MDTAASNPAYTVLPGWEEVVRKVRLSPGLVMVLGESDAGKSTFCSFLVEQLRGQGAAVGFVDSDVGQSRLGPPMTIGGKICVNPEDSLRDLHPPFLYFTGSPTPEGHLLESVVGSVRVVGRVAKASPDWTVMDTTGLIGGESGRRLKIHKVRLLAPQCIVGIQRANELEPILACLERDGRRVLRLPVSPEAKRRSREQRRNNRRAAYLEYFAHAKPLDIEIASVSIHDCPADLVGAFGGSVVTAGPVAAGGVVRGMLVGINNEEGDTLAVGRILEADWGRGLLRLLAPPLDSHAIRSLTISGAAAECALEDSAPP